MDIRPVCAADADALWEIFREVAAGGDTYVFDADKTREFADAYWFGPGVSAWVAVEDGRVLGVYKIVANQRDRGAHVANASYMVGATARGRGLGAALGRHSLEQARALGYAAMQFNFVVSTNTAAVTLWQRLGFAIVGTLPGAYRHEQLGFVDAYVMYRSLGDA
ncbi:MAG TPA: GNAT family N-acetyltransferase [Tahibacter sp.]|nr:GNAT family N-acetyltransferase [Tahibacter sp.]